MIKQIGKILLVSSFLISGLSKFTDFYRFTNTLNEMEFEQSTILGAMIILAQIGGSLLIILSDNDTSVTLSNDGKIIKKDNINIKKKYGKLGIIALMIYILFNSYYFDYYDNVKLIQSMSIFGALILLYMMYK